MLTVMPGGILADQFNPKLSLMLAISIMSLFTMLIPVLAVTNFYAVFAARFAIGLGEASGITYFTPLQNRIFSSDTDFVRNGTILARGCLYFL